MLTIFGVGSCCNRTGYPSSCGPWLLFCCLGFVGESSLLSRSREESFHLCPPPVPDIHPPPPGALPSHLEAFLRQSHFSNQLQYTSVYMSTREHHHEVRRFLPEIDCLAENEHVVPCTKVSRPPDSPCHGSSLPSDFLQQAIPGWPLRERGLPGSAIWHACRIEPPPPYRTSLYK